MCKEELVKNKMFRCIVLIIVIVCSFFSLWKNKSDAIQALKWYQKTVIHDQEILQGEQLNKEQLIIQLPQQETLKLNCLYACLMDGESQRVLYAKDAQKEVPMASTTKIMTLLVVLEKADLNDIVTVSSYAARQPDVQLNINTGEQYLLGDLCYSLMLESHNDTAVAIAEHVGGTVENFCNMMTNRAKELGAYHTSFKTPNGLDADGHYTTAYDLSLIASYAITNSDFCKIVGTTTHQFDEVNRKRSFTVNNKNRFLYMMEGAIGIKTGFTGKAGYCFVGAIRQDGKTLISTVLGSGWPPHKEYKWADTRKLMKYGLDNFTTHYLIEKIENKSMLRIPPYITVIGGKEDTAQIKLAQDITNQKLLFLEGETVTVEMSLNESVVAPCKKEMMVGYMNYHINDTLYNQVPIVLTDDIEKVDFFFLIKKLLAF